MARVNDPAPLSRRQVCALGSATGRELVWGLRAVQAEVAGWGLRARGIPDPAIRGDALSALVAKRSLVEGAARFWSLPNRRSPDLLRLLVAFQVMADLLDTRSEARAGAGLPSTDIMNAFCDAVDVDQPRSDYYRDDPGPGDGGYLERLVQTCRERCLMLPRYHQAQPLLARYARLARSLDVHHDPDPQRRTAALEGFATTELTIVGDEMLWFERAAGTSSALVVIVLLALAAEPSTTDQDLAAAAEAYTWISALSMVLDSHADQLDDAVSGHVSFVSYYSDEQAATERIAFLIDRSLRKARALRHGERHVLIVAMMVAMFLSRDDARSDQLSASTRELVAAGGSLTRVLVPVLRFWRVTYRQQAG